MRQGFEPLADERFERMNQPGDGRGIKKGGWGVRFDIDFSGWREKLDEVRSLSSKRAI
jgi:hypothetical protein